MKIDLPSRPFQMTPETDAELVRIEHKIADHERDFAESQRLAAELEAVEPQDWTPHHDAQATRLRASRAESLHREVVIRAAIGELFATIQNVDYPAARRAAHSEIAESLEWAKTKLREIGFVEAPGVSGVASMALHHPRYRAADQLDSSLLKYRPQAEREANEAALKQCREKLAAMKKSVVAPLV